MSLDLINEVFNNLKENKFVQNFLNEISDCLENDSKNNLNYKDEQIPIIEKILSENNVTTGNENSIRFKEDDIIIEYAEKNYYDDVMYFVKDSKKAYWLNNKRHYNNDVYNVLKVHDKKIEQIEVNKKDMPKNIGVNDVFRIEKGEYVIDTIATKQLREEIINMADEILHKQDSNLDRYRKEGHLYVVTKEVNNNRFLCDLTEGEKIEFEEVSLPKELLEKAVEGTVLKYIDGKYEYYSDDGFDRT